MGGGPRGTLKGAKRPRGKRPWVDEPAETEAKAAGMLNGARRDHAEAEGAGRPGRWRVTGHGSKRHSCALVYRPCTCGAGMKHREQEY